MDDNTTSFTEMLTPSGMWEHTMSNRIGNLVVSMVFN